ncbi:Serine/arginine-rich splicing factor 9 [Dirofilaria immitis]|nr:Serine/arginine-rich splicing factor 9 [Dirofilaria immitis]
MAGRRDCRVYIGNLPPDIRQRDLEDLFYKYGHINFIDVKLTRGAPFAFIEFDDPRDARDAIRGRDGYELDGCRIRVEMTRGVGPRGPGGRPLYGPDRGERDRRPPPPRGPPRRSGYRVLVTGLPVTGSWQDLKDHMREAGDICYADVFKDGTGVVEYTRQDDMKYAIKKLDDTKFKSHEGETSYIRVKEAAIDDRYRSRSRSPRGSPKYSPKSASRSRSRSPIHSASPARSSRSQESLFFSDALFLISACLSSTSSIEMRPEFNKFFKHCLCEDIDRDNQRPLHSIQPNQQNVSNATPNLRLSNKSFPGLYIKNNVEGMASISTPTSASTSPESPIPDLLAVLCNALWECLAAKR